jgi:hypothetical protein
MRKIKNRYNAESAFCELFVEAGRTIGVPSFGAEPPYSGTHLTLSTVKAIHQCEFEDPHFIGGPGAFNFAKSAAEVERIFSRAEPIAAELSNSLQLINSEQAIKFRSDLLSLKEWMSRNC